MEKGQQAVTDFEPGMRYRPLAIGEGAGGASQAPEYILCLLGTARAQAHFDRAAATRSDQQLLDIWKTPTRISSRHKRPDENSRP
jgi:hypothetical protein